MRRPTFTTIALVLATWLVLGAYVDAWTHHHLFFETFFTPWHALLYSAAGANTAFYGGWWLSHRRQVPEGYRLSLFGSVAFMTAGACDLVWHGVFGIERDFAAILSPTHLGLMLSAGLIVTGPARAAWRSEARRLPFPAAWSMTLLIAMFFFFMQDLSPLVAQWANPTWSTLASLRAAEMLGLNDMLLATAVLIGPLLVSMARFELRIGQLMLLLACPADAIVLTYKPDLILVVPVLTALFAEVLRLLIQPSGTRVMRSRILVVVLTAFMWSFYMWGLAATVGTWWPIPSELGVVVATVIGVWLLTYLVFPPRHAVPPSSSRVEPASLP